MVDVVGRQGKVDEVVVVDVVVAVVVDDGVRADQQLVVDEKQPC